jgi:hypothetical protein
VSIEDGWDLEGAGGACLPRVRLNNRLTSRRFSLRVAEQPTEALPTDHLACLASNCHVSRVPNRNPSSVGWSVIPTAWTGRVASAITTSVVSADGVHGCERFKAKSPKISDSPGFSGKIPSH